VDRRLNATDLINPKSTLSGKLPVMKETKQLVPAARSIRTLATRVDSRRPKEWKKQRVRTVQKLERASV
jgi:methionyl-tRNA synthetase